MKAFTKRFFFAAWLYLSIVPLTGITAAAIFQPGTAGMAAAVAPAAERGMPFVRNYSPAEWEHLTDQVDTYCILQDRQGVMAIGSSSGVLRYNGVSWQLVETANKSIARDLAMDAAGRVYVAASNELGYLAPGPDGKMRYVSLLAHLPAEDRTFGDILKVYATPEGVYFQSERRLFRWRNGRFTRWQATTTFQRAFWVGTRLYVQEPGRGLSVLQGNGLQIVSRDTLFRGATVRAMLPLDDGSIFVATRDHGLYRFDGKDVHRLPGNAQTLASLNAVYNGVRLPDGSLALATLQGGVLVTDARGDLRHVIDKNSGLSRSTVHNVASDNAGGLWVALNKGVSRVDLASPFTRFNEHNGLPGFVQTLARHEGALLAGTGEGFFRLVPGASPGAPAGFGVIREFDHRVLGLLPVGESLLICGSGGTHQYRNGKITHVTPQGGTGLKLSKRYPDVVFLPDPHGLFILHREGDTWRNAGPVPGVPRAEAVTELPNGDLWVTTTAQGVYRVRYSAGSAGGGYPALLQPAAVQAFGPAQGVPPDAGKVFATGQEVLLRTGKRDAFRLFRLNEAKGIFEPLAGFGKRFGLGDNGAWPEYYDAAHGEWWLWVHRAGRTRSYWASATPGPGGKYRLRKYTFDHIRDYVAGDFFPEANGVAWFAGKEGLLRLERESVPAPEVAFGLLIQRVAAGRDSVLYPGRPGAVAELPFRLNSLRFDVAAPVYGVEKETVYSYLLEGYDEGWSAWTPEPFRAYTRIPEGTYTFRVRAMGATGAPGREATFSFRLLPPWYRTWPLYLGYALAAAGAVYGFLRMRLAKVRAEKLELARTVRHRTQEVAQKNVQLAEQASQLAAQNELLTEQAAEMAATNEQLAEQSGQLAEKTRQLQEMDRVKSNFFANISHEFRTPLTLLLGSLQDKINLLRAAGGDAQPVRRQELDVMHRNAARLLTLINQLLDLSKLESGQLHLEPRAGDLGKFFGVMAASFSSLADSRQIHFRLLLPGDPLYYRFDADKLEKITVNLLSNAFKFTPLGGEVTLRVEASAGRVRLAVQDSGSGIAPEQLPKVFDRFYGGTGHYADGQGTGIGLALVKELVQLHAGQVTVESDALRGTQFVVELPLTPITAADLAAEATPAAPSAALPLLPVPEPGETGPQPVPGRTAPEEMPLLLLVEDNADLRAYVRQHLEGHYRVVESENGRQGLDAALRHVPDLIVTDWMMPDMNGLELCEKVKTDERISHIPVIMLTALATQESKLQGLETGADEYLTKPFDARELQLRVRNLIETRRRLRERFGPGGEGLPAGVAPTSVDEKLLQRMLAITEAHLASSDFGPEEFAREVGMSRMQLHRKLTALTGQSTSDFLRTLRLKRAAHLLTAKTGNVSEVAFAVGFNSLAYFSKCFKEQYGVPASEYVAQHTEP
ncbi:MAG: response regulator [Cytophagales bacterium]|nr:response regulator [Cytophagales bacterium]